MWILNKILCLMLVLGAGACDGMVGQDEASYDMEDELGSVSAPLTLQPGPGTLYRCACERGATHACFDSRRESPDSACDRECRIANKGQYTGNKNLVAQNVRCPD